MVPQNNDLLSCCSRSRNHIRNWWCHAVRRKPRVRGYAKAGKSSQISAHIQEDAAACKAARVTLQESCCRPVLAVARLSGPPCRWRTLLSWLNHAWKACSSSYPLMFRAVTLSPPGGCRPGGGGGGGGWLMSIRHAARPRQKSACYPETNLCTHSARCKYSIHAQPGTVSGSHCHGRAHPRGAARWAVGILGFHPIASAMPQTLYKNPHHGVVFYGRGVV